MVDKYAAFFDYTLEGRKSDPMIAPTENYSFKLVRSGTSNLLLGPTGLNIVFFCSRFSVIMLFGVQGISIAGELIVSVSHHLQFILGVIMIFCLSLMIH